MYRLMLVVSIGIKSHMLKGVFWMLCICEVSLNKYIYVAWIVFKVTTIHTVRFKNNIFHTSIPTFCSLWRSIYRYVYHLTLWIDLLKDILLGNYKLNISQPGWSNIGQTRGNKNIVLDNQKIFNLAKWKFCVISDKTFLFF